MKFSIITCVYNNSTTLEGALESVFNQKDVIIEHIIIDGDSTDSSVEIIKNWSSKIIKNRVLTNYNLKYISEKDKGLYDALNKGIKLATGEIIGILHADDETLIRVEDEFKNNNCDGLYGDLDYVHKNDCNKIIRHWKSGIYKKAKIYYGWMPPHPTLFLNKNVFTKYGNYDIKYKIASDYDFILRILLKSDIKLFYIPKVITKMKIGGKSNKSIRNIFQKSIEDFKALKNNGVKRGIIILILKNIRKITQFSFIKGYFIK